MDFIFLFLIRKNVPRSLCFTQQDMWQFEENRAYLQMLWREYHSFKPPLQSCYHFLSFNFIPKQYMTPNPNCLNYNNIITDMRF